jgi:hypothetical protein
MRELLEDLKLVFLISTLAKSTCKYAHFFHVNEGIQWTGDICIVLYISDSINRKIFRR